MPTCTNQNKTKRTTFATTIGNDRNIYPDSLAAPPFFEADE